MKTNKAHRWIQSTLLEVMTVCFVLCGMSMYSQTRTKTEVIESVKKSVVWIHAFGMPVMNQDAEYGTGTGYVIEGNDIVLTNHHVVKDVKGVMIFTPNTTVKEPYYATVVWSDSVLDLAVLKVFDLNLPALRIANEQSIRQGDEVLVLGYPGASYKEGKMKVSWGIISSETADSTIQITAAINSGNSGGPCINMSGEVIGTVFAKMIGVEIEGTGFIRSSRFIQEAVASARPFLDGQLKYFGTTSVLAYKKLCQAQLSAWQVSETESSIEQKRLIERSQTLIKEAMDLDPQYAEAHLFLASYFFQEAFMHCIGGDDVSAKRKVLDCKYEISEAIKSKPSLRYDSKVQNMSTLTEGKELDCTLIRKFLATVKEESDAKVARYTDWFGYLYYGETPKILKEKIKAVSGDSHDSEIRQLSRKVDELERRLSSKTTTDQTYSQSTHSSGSIGVSLFIRVPMAANGLFDGTAIETPVKEGEVQVEILSDVRLLGGLSYNTTPHAGPGLTFNVGAGVGPFTARYNLAGENGSMLVEKWSLDFVTKQPSRYQSDYEAKKIDVVWSIGVGQIIVNGYQFFDEWFTFSDDMKGYVLRSAFDFRLTGVFWGNIGGAVSIGGGDFSRLNVGLGVRM